MRLSISLGNLFLAIYLILIGLTYFLGGILIPPIVFGLIALAAGILILLGK